SFDLLRLFVPLPFAQRFPRPLPLLFRRPFPFRLLHLLGLGLLPLLRCIPRRLWLSLLPANIDAFIPVPALTCPRHLRRLLPVNSRMPTVDADPFVGRLCQTPRGVSQKRPTISSSAIRAATPRRACRGRAHANAARFRRRPDRY